MFPTKLQIELYSFRLKILGNKLTSLQSFWRNFRLFLSWFCRRSFYSILTSIIMFPNLSFFFFWSKATMSSCQSFFFVLFFFFGYYYPICLFYPIMATFAGCKWGVQSCYQGCFYERYFAHCTLFFKLGRAISLFSIILSELNNHKTRWLFNSGCSNQAAHGERYQWSNENCTLCKSKTWRTKQRCKLLVFFPCICLPDGIREGKELTFA